MDLRSLRDVPPWEWPNGADTEVLELLGDSTAEEADRVIAAELAGDPSVINEELADALLGVVRDGVGSEQLRCEAASALGPLLDLADTDGFDEDSDVPISEETFRGICDALRRLYMDAEVPERVRRRILEASVRAPQEWHRNAIRAAYLSGDADWKLTAVFAMRWIGGFDEQILDALDSSHPEIRYHAVCAAGDWEIDAAWSQVAAIIQAPPVDKALLLAAIESAASIRPNEAGTLLIALTASDDENIAEAALDAMVMAEGVWDEDEPLE